MKLRLVNLIVAAVAVGWCSLAIRAQPKPDLNGTWKMDKSKSKFQDPDTAPKDILIRFDQQGATLRETITVTGAYGESIVNMTYSLEGKETINSMKDIRDVKSTARWDGQTLVIEWRGKYDRFTRRFDFGDSGRTMVMNAHDYDPEAGGTSLVVLQKQ